MKRKIYRKVVQIQNTLESYRRFDYDYIPQGTGWTMPDGTYPYRQRGFTRFVTGFWRTMMQLVSPLAIRIAYGAKVTGKKNLRALKKTGAISVTNHFNFLDTLFVREAVGYYRSFHTMGPFNNRKGFVGHLVRHGGMLPFSADRAAMKNATREIERLLRKGKIVNFYPEQALWFNYRKPRPMKDGAFHYAVKFGVPVLPIFCTFQKRKNGNVKKLRINILPVVFADETLPKGARVRRMKEQAEAAWKNCYEAAYGVPLAYLPSEKKQP